MDTNDLMNDEQKMRFGYIEPLVFYKTESLCKNERL